VGGLGVVALADGLLNVCWLTVGSAAPSDKGINALP